ncbi:hypothetical protein Q1695_001734 [Nippostrongylus brasiliensis]|nr:hypothetical protein Q1695_001734 [Nippostrongylus brasiliensis]
MMFYLFSGTDDERDFEKAFGESARKLLNQDREKHKSKIKIPKRKDLKEKRTEAKQDNDLDVELVSVDAGQDLLNSSPTFASASSTALSSSEPRSMQSRNDKSTAVDDAEGDVEGAVVTGGEPESVVESIIDDNKENRNEQSSSSEGKRKKRSKRKDEEALGRSDVTEHVENEVTAESHSSSSVASKSDKEKKLKKKVAIVNVKDLDSNKVLTRIASLDEIEPEYISYLATYFHDSYSKINMLESLIGDYEKKEMNYKKKIDQYQLSRVISERQISDHVRVISELTSKLQALSVSEASLKQQNLQLNNVRVENDALKSALSKSAADAAAGAKVLANLELLKANNVELNERLTKMNRTLNETVEQNASLKREIVDFSEQVAALDVLKQEFATLDSVARQLKAELMDKTRVIEEGKVMTFNGESVKRAENERDEIAHQFSQARCEWEKKEAALMDEYTSLKNLVDELNEEVAKFEQFKKEQDELEQKLLAKEAELAEKSARLAAAETEKQVLVIKGRGRSVELEIENADLRKQLIDMKERLDEVTKSHTAVLTELAEVRSKLCDDENNQHRIAVNSLQCTDSDSETAVLRAENDRLQQKNEELRRRNFKILDDVTTLEEQLRERISSSCSATPFTKLEGEQTSLREQLLEERRLVASAIGSIVNSPLNDTRYDEYVKCLASSLRSTIDQAKALQGREDSSGSNTVNTRAELENYKRTFESLAALMSQIEEGVQEQESFYRGRISQLENDLDKAQIHALRKCLGQNEETKDATSPKSIPVKSDESDWEVVSR